MGPVADPTASSSSNSSLTEQHTSVLVTESDQQQRGIATNRVSPTAVVVKTIHQSTAAVAFNRSSTSSTCKAVGLQLKCQAEQIGLRGKTTTANESQSIASSSVRARKAALCLCGVCINKTLCLCNVFVWCVCLFGVVIVYIWAYWT